MSQQALEPFPALNMAHHALHREPSRSQHSSTGTRPRRRSSGLGAELPGDSNVRAFATLSPPLSPAPASPLPADKSQRRSKRRKVKSFLRRWKQISLRHTWINPLIICALIVSLYLFNPTPENPVHALLFLSYPLPRASGEDESVPLQYGKGAKDFAFIAFYMVFFTFTREFCMQRLIRPIAISAGIRSRVKLSRFMEQGYTALYFIVLGPFGLYVMSRTPIWYFNTTAMYEEFPHRTHEAVFKAYYLLQASYWAQQGVVLMLLLEKPRKDFKELVGHHVITLALIWLSYRFHFTYMGLAVYITHDISDFFLATSKLLNYLDSIFVAPYFFIFVCIWTYLRHYINLRILWSILTEYSEVGPYELNWETQQYKCTLSKWITFSLLASLQAVNIFWLFLILRIAYRFVSAKELDDDRSEYEESEVDEDAVRDTVKTPNGSANGYAKMTANGHANGTATTTGVNTKPANGSAGALRDRK